MSGMIRIKFLPLLFVLGFLYSCASARLNVNGVVYHAIRNVDSVDGVPDSAKIVVQCDVSVKGIVEVTVINKTDKVLLVDRTKSFFRDKENNSYPYYDPTVNVHTTSYTSGNTTGGTVNLGGVARAAGIGGAVGTALNSVTVGGAHSSLSTSSHTTYQVNQPILTIAPYGKATMGMTFYEQYYDAELLHNMIEYAGTDLFSKSYVPDKSFSSSHITISYSFDNGETYDIIGLGIYTQSLIIQQVVSTGHVNDALRSVIQSKPDLLEEDWYAIIFPYNNFDMFSTFGSGGERTYAYKARRSKFINYK